MNAERLNELGALNAAGALEGADLQDFQHLLASADPDVQAELARFHNLAALLATSQSTPCRPEPQLKAKIMERITGASPPGARSEMPLLRPDFYSILRHEGEWMATPIPGVRTKELAVDAARGYAVMLIAADPGARYPNHHHCGGEECYVLSGDFHVQDRVLHAGDFHHAEAGTDHGESFTEQGCTLLLVVPVENYS